MTHNFNTKTLEIDKWISFEASSGLQAGLGQQGLQRETLSLKDKTKMLVHEAIRFKVFIVVAVVVSLFLLFFGFFSVLFFVVV